VVQQKGVPEEVPEQALALEGEASMTLLDALDRLGMVASRSEGRRMVQQGAVQLNGERVDDANAPLEAGEHLLRVGKRRYCRLLLNTSS